MDEVGPLQLFLPVTIPFDLIHEDGTLFASVPTEVALTVRVYIQPSDASAALHRPFQGRCVHSASPPLDVARKFDVHRQESRHGFDKWLLQYVTQSGSPRDLIPHARCTRKLGRGPVSVQ